MKRNLESALPTWHHRLKVFLVTFLLFLTNYFLSGQPVEKRNLTAPDNFANEISSISWKLKVEELLIKHDLNKNLEWFSSQNSQFDFSFGNERLMPKDGWKLEETEKYIIKSMVKPQRVILGFGDWNFRGFTPNDISNFEFLDSLYQKIKLTDDEYNRTLRIIKGSDLFELVRYGLATLGNFSHPPEWVVNEILWLQSQPDTGCFHCDLAETIGKLHIPRTFPAILRYFHKNALNHELFIILNSINDFGIESIAGIHMVASILNSPGDKYKDYDEGKRFFKRLPMRLFSLCGNGLGFLLWYEIPPSPWPLLHKESDGPFFPRLINSLKVAGGPPWKCKRPLNRVY